MAEAPRSSILSGYDEEFVTEVDDDYQCKICCLPLREPVLTRCGHRYCKECLEEHSRRQEERGFLPFICPTDRNELDRDRDVFPDKATERKILSLAIKCPSDGCEWSGELREKETHLHRRCLWKLISCTNKNCLVKVQRGNLNNHVKNLCQWRMIACGHCRELCAKCEMKVTNHTETNCPLTMIACPYQHMGCQSKTYRREVESHIETNIKSHLNLACVKLKNTEKELHTRTFIWKVDNFGEILEQAKTEVVECIESDPFYTARTESYGYKLKVSIYPNGEDSGENTHLSVFIVVMKGEYDAILPWPFKKRVKLTVIDQQEDTAQRENVTKTLIALDDLESFGRPVQEENTGWGYSQFISHEKLNSRRYLVDDTLFLQVEVGPP